MSSSEEAPATEGARFEPVGEYVLAIRSGERAEPYVDALRREWEAGGGKDREDRRDDLLQNYFRYLSSESPEVAANVVGVMSDTMPLHRGNEYTSDNESPRYVISIVLPNLKILADSYLVRRGRCGPSGDDFLRAIHRNAGREDLRLRREALDNLVQRPAHERDLEDVVADIRCVHEHDGLEAAIECAEQHAADFHEALEDQKERLVRTEVDNLRRALAASRPGGSDLGLPRSGLQQTDELDGVDAPELAPSAAPVEGSRERGRVERVRLSKLRDSDLLRAVSIDPAREDQDGVPPERLLLKRVEKQRDKGAVLAYRSRPDGTAKAAWLQKRLIPIADLVITSRTKGRDRVPKTTISAVLEKRDNDLDVAMKDFGGVLGNLGLGGPTLRDGYYVISHLPAGYSI